METKDFTKVSATEFFKYIDTNEYRKAKVGDVIYIKDKNNVIFNEIDGAKGDILGFRKRRLPIILVDKNTYDNLYNNLIGQKKRYIELDTNKLPNLRDDILNGFNPHSPFTPKPFKPKVPKMDFWTDERFYYRFDYNPYNDREYHRLDDEIKRQICKKVVESNLDTDNLNETFIKSVIEEYVGNDIDRLFSFTKTEIGKYCYNRNSYIVDKLMDTEIEKLIDYINLLRYWFTTIKNNRHLRYKIYEAREIVKILEANPNMNVLTVRVLPGDGDFERRKKYELDYNEVYNFYKFFQYQEYVTCDYGFILSIYYKDERIYVTRQGMPKKQHRPSY